MEDKIKTELEIADLKTEYLRKSLDQAHAQASSILLFNLKWRDLEDHFEKTRTLVERRAQEVSLRERQLGETAVSLEQRCREVERKERELGDVQRKVDDFCADEERRQSQLDSIRHLMQECTEELSVKGKQLSVVRNSLNAFNNELCSKEEQLNGMLKSIEDHKVELCLKEKQLKAVCESIDYSNKEFCSKEKQFSEVRKSIEDSDRELVLKKEQLGLVQDEIEACHKQLNLKEEELKSAEKSVKECLQGLQLKERELGSVKRNLEEHCRELSAKNEELRLNKKQLGLCQYELEECGKQLNSKKELLASLEKSLKECIGELQLKGKQLGSVKRNLAECCQEFSTKDEALRLNREQLDSCQNDLEQCHKKLNLKKEELKSLEESAKECSGELQSKERELASVKRALEERCRELYAKDAELHSNKEQLGMSQNELEECHKQLNLKKEELKSLEKSAKECSGELQLKERELGSVKRTLAECCGELSAKDQELHSNKEQLGLCENELEECRQQLNLEKEELKSLEKKLNMLRGSIRDSPGELYSLKNEFDGVNKSNQECTQGLELRKKQINKNITNDGRNLMFFLAKHLNDQDSLYAEVIVTFTKSPDPAKLVLDELHSSSWKDSMEFNSNIMRRTSILLLEQLMKLSPHIKPEIREDAMKLAKEWKAELSEPPDNKTQVMAFMLLLATFKLLSDFNINELYRLLDFLGQQRQVAELRLAIKEATELPLSKTLPSKVKVKQNEHLTVNSKTDTSFATVKFCTSKEVSDLLMVLNDRDGSQPKVLAAIRISRDPLKLVLDTMQESLYQLWEKGDTGFQASFMRNCIVLLEQAMRVSQKIHPQPQVKAAAKKLAMEWKEKLRANTDNSFEVLGFLQFLATYEVVSSFKRDEISRLIDIVTPHIQAPEISRALSFADKIPGLIRDLISRRRHLDAVRFSCEFNLVGMFPPSRLLKQYWEITGRAVSSITKKGKSAQEALAHSEEAKERELGTLKAIIRCVTDNKLEKEFSTVDIRKRLDELVRQKTGGRHSVTTPSTPAQLPLQDEHSSLNASVPRDQLQQRTSKRPRTDEPITTPYAPRPRVSNQK